jgi:hypothetical protein
LSCSGKVGYGRLTPLKYDIMGPFSVIPFMECKHGIISLKHTLSGSLSVNGSLLNFDGGTGYIEKDRGHSFPKRYLWIQCNSFKNEDCSVMASIADIPFSGFEFKGCICAVYYKNREYRLATYTGVKIIRDDEKGIILKQGKLKLEIDILKNESCGLLAPDKGDMSRTIHEATSCKAEFRFYSGNDMIFDLCSDHTSFEYMYNV